MLEEGKVREEDDIIKGEKGCVRGVKGVSKLFYMLCEEGVSDYLVVGGCGRVKFEVGGVVWRVGVFVERRDGFL